METKRHNQQLERDIRAKDQQILANADQMQGLRTEMQELNSQLLQQSVDMAKRISQQQAIIESSEITRKVSIVDL